MTDRRFGVSAWCHPEIERELSESNPLEQFEELIDKVIFRDGSDAPERLSASDIHAKLINDSLYGPLARQILRASSIAGRHLSDLVKKKPGRFQKRETKGRVSYIISAP